MASLRYVRFLVFAAALFAGLALRAPACHAQTISLTTISGADFGTITAPSPKPTGTHNIEMGTDGTVDYGTAGYTGPATATVARLQLSGPNGTGVSLSCSQTATLTNNITRPGSTTLTMGTIRIRVGSTAGPGSGTTCTGTNNGILTVHISGNASNNIIYIDETFNASNVKIDGAYQGNLTVRARATSGSGSGTVSRTSATTVTFNDTLGISNVVDLDYGVAGIAGAIGAGSNIDLGTDGSRNATGNFTLAGGTPNPGQFSVTGASSGESLTVYCDTTATLTNAAGTSSINVTGIEVHTPSLIGPYAGGNCRGLGTAAGTWVYNPATNATLYMGGRLNGSTASGTLSGLFSTANPGGAYATIVVVRQ